MSTDETADTSTSTNADPQTQLAPLAGPAWRWRLAHGVGGGPHAPAADEYVAGAKAFVAERDAGKAQAAQPQTAAAVQLWEDPAARRAIELLTLAGCPPARIAERLGVNETNVAWVERLFFDVPARLAATDWIHCHVVAPYERRGEVERAVECHAALIGGEDAAELILNGQFGGLQDRAKRLAAQQAQLDIKCQAALRLPVTAANQMPLLRYRLAYDVATQRHELAKQKFAAACEQAAAKQRRAQARLDAAEERRRTAALVKENRAASARLAEAERVARFHAEQRAADQRAAASPLAALRWSAPTAASVPPPATSHKNVAHGKQVAAAGRPRKRRRRPARSPARPRQTVGAA